MLVEDPALVRSEILKSTIPQNEPINLAVVDAPDYVLAITVAFVNAQLFVQVIADATGGNLGDKLRHAHDVAVLVKYHLAITIGLDEEHGIGLGALPTSRSTVLLSPSSVPGVLAAIVKSQPTSVACGLP